ncbi:hypothetical protein DPMN_039612 [Dreissena polymorpha]|uniref:Uncharacterized protein n=1 Tax=Dreissena polymorpha TaxID=45954 RepID=A0A9D4CTM9_DREPO|nr:hypothetical protein DPMN_039612 [Dreissena polymorpha]
MARTFVAGPDEFEPSGIRGLCNGLGPALFGFIFYLFHVDLNETTNVDTSKVKTLNASASHTHKDSIIPGPPFAFGTVLVIIAMLVAINIPDSPHPKKTGVSKAALQLHQSIEQGLRSDKEDVQPLMAVSEEEVL